MVDVADWSTRVVDGCQIEVLAKDRRYLRCASAR